VIHELTNAGFNILSYYSMSKKKTYLESYVDFRSTSS